MPWTRQDTKQEDAQGMLWKRHGMHGMSELKLDGTRSSTWCVFEHLGGHVWALGLRFILIF